MSNKPVNLILILEERLLRAELGLRAVTEQAAALAAGLDALHGELHRRLDKLDPPVRKRA